MWSREQWAIVENELECHRLWKEIQARKKELQRLYEKWKVCNSKSVYHVDPGLDFTNVNDQ